MIYIGYVLLDLYLFFILYVACMGMIRAHHEKQLNWALSIMCLPFVATSYIFNVVNNITVFSLVFWELPKDWTVSERMKRHYHEHTYRGKIARWICDTLLKSFDVDHCDG